MPDIMPEDQNKKVVIGLVIFGVFAAVFILIYMVIESFSSQVTGSDWVKSGAPNSGIVVISDRLIPKGTVIGPDDLLEVKREPEKIPPQSVICKDVIIGKKTKIEIPYNEYIAIKNFADEAAVAQKQQDYLDKRKSKDDPICHHQLMPDYWKVKDQMVTVKEEVPAEGRFDASNLDYLYESGKRIDDSIYDKWQAVNRLSKFGVGKGQPITTQDFLATDREVFVYKAKTDLDPEHKITMEDLLEVKIPSRECPGTAVLDGKTIVGREVVQPIDQGNMIKASYLD